MWSEARGVGKAGGCLQDGGVRPPYFELPPLPPVCLLRPWMQRTQSQFLKPLFFFLLLLVDPAQPRLGLFSSSLEKAASILRAQVHRFTLGGTCSPKRLLTPRLTESPGPASESTPQPPLCIVPLLQAFLLLSDSSFFSFCCQDSFMTCLLHLLPPPDPRCLQGGSLPWAGTARYDPGHLGFKGLVCPRVLLCPNPPFAT